MRFREERQRREWSGRTRNRIWRGKSQPDGEGEAELYSPDYSLYITRMGYLSAQQIILGGT